MISITDLRRIAQARLGDAEALLTAGRYDGAAYMTGYAVELALKARICETLKWSRFPSTAREFSEYQSLRTHDLRVLLHFTGREDVITEGYAAEWSAVVEWNPSVRYQVIGTVSEADATTMVGSARILVREI